MGSLLVAIHPYFNCIGSHGKLKKKNQFHVNISNTKSPRFIPLTVTRPIEAYKGNFLNDFHKNYLNSYSSSNKLNSKSHKEKDNRFIDSSKNYDVSSLNKYSSNLEKDKNSSYKHNDILPLINSPILNINKIDFNENNNSLIKNNNGNYISFNFF